MKKNNNYILFWLSQSVSEVGSAMTSFALIIWVYTQTKSVFSVSMLTFFTYAPYILVSVFAGLFIDKHSKKRIIMFSDSIAALSSLSVCILIGLNELQIWHVYIVNAICGLMNSFQSPASAVAVGIIVPKDKYEKVSGLNSFSQNLITVVNPMLATTVLSIGGLKSIILIDMITFVIATLVLLFFIKIPEGNFKEEEEEGIFQGCKAGFLFLKNKKGLIQLMLSMALLNFFSRLTYENILAPMILARSGENQSVLGIVTGILGLGGILGGIIVATIKLPKDKVKVLYFSAALSFLFGDVLMGLGQNVIIWSIGALAASLPIPFVFAAQSVLLYNNVPTKMQGRVFAVRNIIQYTTIPIAILLGGILADYVFEPFMKNGTVIARFLISLVGNTEGNGMAVMFLCTGILGFISCIILSENKIVKELCINNTNDIKEVKEKK